MEGGAHVILEAVLSGTPILASLIDGNVGMLGVDYAGYFPWSNAGALAALIIECRTSQDHQDGLMQRLSAQCAKRSHLFAPDAERDALRQLILEMG